GVADRLCDKREDLGDEDSWRGLNGDSGIDRDALEWPCQIRMARGPKPRKRLGVSEGIRHFDHHRLRPLLRGRRKTACMDELDSCRYRTDFADLSANPHLSG